LERGLSQKRFLSLWLVWRDEKCVRRFKKQTNFKYKFAIT
jgi:hypothetical protein